MSHPGYLHGPLQMLGPENEVCNYLALEKINDMSILWIRAFSPPELKDLYVVYLKGGGGGGGEGVTSTPGHPPSPLAMPLNMIEKSKYTASKIWRY